MGDPGPITLAWTGASGIQYGLRLLEHLVGANQQVYLLVSDPARLVLKMEADFTLPARTSEMQVVLQEHFDAADGQITVFGSQEWTSPVASGSGAPRRMVVCPCTTATLANMAHGTGDNLITRAADVVLKERGQLIVIPRETPYTPIMLENMLSLSRAGALILPANPGFYHRPQSVEDVVDFIAARVLDHLGVPQELVARWGHEEDD